MPVPNTSISPPLSLLAQPARPGRSRAEEAHADQPLQRTAGLAGCRPSHAGWRGLRRLRLARRPERRGDSGAVAGAEFGKGRSNRTQTLAARQS